MEIIEFPIQNASDTQLTAAPTELEYPLLLVVVAYVAVAIVVAPVLAIVEVVVEVDCLLL